MKAICRFCNDTGCICCAGERAKRQKETPQTPQPIFVADTNDPADMALLKQFFGAKALSGIATETNGDMAKFSRRVEHSAAVASLIQALHKNKEE